MRSPRPILFPLLLALASAPPALAPSAGAQIPVLEPLPWPEAGRPPARAVVISLDRYEDETTHWLGHRLGVTGLFPAGRRSTLFVRAGYLTLDTARLPVLERWPWLAGEDAGAGWPGERRSVGFSRPEAGVIADVRLPGLGASRIAVALGLPVGRDELYPLTTTSMPLRLFVRRSFALSDSLRISLTVGRIMEADSGRDVLVPEAFPGGWSLQGGFALSLPGGRRLRCGWVEESYETGRSTRVSLDVLLPLAGGHGLGLRVERELAGRLDRTYATRVGISWRLALPGPDGPDGTISEDASSGR